jgi:hypothetical protein
VTYAADATPEIEKLVADTVDAPAMNPKDPLAVEPYMLMAPAVIAYPPVLNLELQEVPGLNCSVPVPMEIAVESV